MEMSINLDYSMKYLDYSIIWTLKAFFPQICKCSTDQNREIKRNLSLSSTHTSLANKATHLLNIEYSKITKTICIFFDKQFAIFLETNREVVVFNMNRDQSKKNCFGVYLILYIQKKKKKKMGRNMENCQKRCKRFKFDEW